uniref:Uncharacterized protein n=1 Tax=Panagrolaimus superbus TaxID=310955 RepID=A0A914YZU1_9BILA
MFYNCQCFSFPKWAKIFAITGIVTSVVTIVLNVFTLTWWYIPMATVSLLTYVLVYFGVEEKRPEYLTPALLILGIHLVVSIWITLTLIYIGWFLPNDIILISHQVAQLLNIHSTIFKIQLFYLITAFFVFSLAVYSLFSFIIIHKARMFLKENFQVSHEIEDNHPIYIAHTSDVLEYPLIHSFRKLPLQSLISESEVGRVNTAF